MEMSSFTNYYIVFYCIVEVKQKNKFELKKIKI